MKTQRLSLNLSIAGRLPVLALAATGLAGCAEQEQAESLEDPTPVVQDVAVQTDGVTDTTQLEAVGQIHATPFDLSSIMRQVHFAYRPQGPDFVGGHTTYSVEVLDGSAVVMRPYLPAEQQGVPDARRENTPLIAEQGAPLVLETTEISRDLGGKESEGSLIGRPRVAEDGSLEIPRDSAVESLKNRDDGVEQSWRFASAPEGDGDLEVWVEARGQEFAGETGDGFHFQDPESGLGFRYGHATWIDARGDRSPVEVEMEDGHLVMRVPEEVVEGSSYPAVLDPVVTPEASLGNAITSYAYGAQGGSAMAYGGGYYLACWHDSRTGDYNIFCSRLNASGAPLDGSGIQVSSTFENQYYPAVTFDGASFAVLWSDYRSGSYADIYGATVTAAGSVNRWATAVSSASYDQRSVSVARRGTYLVAAWESFQNDPDYPDIMGAVLNSAGTVITSLTLATGAQTQGSPDVACDSTNCLVVWDDYAAGAADIKARPIMNNNSLGSTFTVTNAVNNQRLPAIAYGNGSYLVVWDDNQNGADYNIYSAKVSVAWALGAKIALTTAANNQYEPDVVWDGAASRFVSVWKDYGDPNQADIYAARVNSAGSLTDGPFAVATGNDTQYAPAIVANGVSNVVTWTQLTPNAEIYSATVAGTTVSASQRVTNSANGHAETALSFDGTNYVAVWEDSRAGTNTDIYSTRVSTNGAVLDLSGIVVSKQTTHEESPDVSCTASGRCLVCWEDHRNSDYEDIYCSTYVNGTVGAAVAVSTASDHQQIPAIGTDGNDFLVVWQDRQSDYSDIRGAFVSNAGVVSTTPGLLYMGRTDDGKYPDVAYNSSYGKYLVVLDEVQPDTDNDIFGVTVKPSGQIGGAFRINSTTTGQQYFSRVTSASGYFMVAWQTAQNGDWDIVGAKINANTLAVTSLNLYVSSGAHQIDPAISYNGSRYLLTWTEQSTAANSSTDVKGALYDSSGNRVDGPFTLSASGSVNESESDVANAYPTVTNGFLVSWQEYDSTQKATRGRASAVTY